MTQIQIQFSTLNLPLRLTSHSQERRGENTQDFENKAMSSSPGPTRHGVSEGQALLQATLAKAALAKARPSSQESVDTAESTRPIGATDPNIFLQTGPAARPNTPETPTGAVVEVSVSPIA